MNVYLTNNMETKLSFYAQDKAKYAKLTILFISYYLYYYYYYYYYYKPTNTAI